MAAYEPSRLLFLGNAGASPALEVAKRATLSGKTAFEASLPGSEGVSLAIGSGNTKSGKMLLLPGKAAFGLILPEDSCGVPH